MLERPTTAQEFSQRPPILTDAQFQATLGYVAERSVALADTVLGEPLPIDRVCLFAHSPEEYEFVARTVQACGSKSVLTQGATLYVDTNIVIAGQHISILGVRSPDSKRPWRGYGDFPVADYARVRDATARNPKVREVIGGLGKTLLELHHSNFDVLGYVVDERDHRRQA